MVGITVSADDRALSPAQRTEGTVAIVTEWRDGAVRLGRLRQQGSLKALLPAHHQEHALGAVLLNTAGGLTGGDRMRVAIEAGARCRMVVSTQSAERVYRSAHGAAVVETDLRVAAGGRLDWLPQETILYDGGVLDRRLSLDLTLGGRVLLVEPMVIGRRAMGERVRTATLRDHWEVRQDGRLLFADCLLIEGKAWASLGSPGTLAGANAWASLALLAPEASALLPRLRRLLPASAGASLVREGVLFARILAEDGFQLREALLPAIECLAGGPLPKVWRL